MVKLTLAICALAKALKAIDADEEMFIEDTEEEVEKRVIKNAPLSETDHKKLDKLLLLLDPKFQEYLDESDRKLIIE